MPNYFLELKQGNDKPKYTYYTRGSGHLGTNLVAKNLYFKMQV